MKLLVITQIHEDADIDSDYVRCPACGKGRLCDKTIGDKVTVIAIQDTAHSRKSSGIILKCPKCAGKFIIRQRSGEEY